MKLTFEKDIDDVYGVGFWEWGVKCLKSWLLRVMSMKLTFEKDIDDVYRVDFW